MADSEKNTARTFTEYRNMGMMAMALTIYNHGPAFLDCPLPIKKTKIVVTPRMILSTKPRNLGSPMDVLPFFAMCKTHKLSKILIYVESILMQDPNPIENPWKWQYLLLKYTQITGSVPSVVDNT